MMVSILCHRRLRSQADSVANLPDGSDKFSQRNPKIDFREYERRLLVAKPPPAMHCRHCKIVDFAIEPGIKGSPVAVCLMFVLCYEMKRRLSYSDDKNDMKHRLFCIFSISLLLTGLSAGSAVTMIPASAEGTSGDYTYEVDSETLKGYLTGYTGQDTEIVLPEELDGTVIAGIAADTFYNCDTLEKITIPATITEIGESAFFDCDHLKEFAVAEDSETYYAKDGVLFRKKDDCLMAYPPALPATSYTVPDGVKELYYAAFGKCTNLQEIQLPDSLQYIDDWAFAYDTFSSISIPDSVVEICDYAFAYCENVTEWTLPTELTYIGNGAFAGCTGMTEVVLPTGLSIIGQAAFAGTGLKEITIPASVEEIGYSAFGYEVDMTTTVKNFTIYGESGSAAQKYAADSDEEYSYQNSFSFVTVQNADIVRGGRGQEDLSATEEISEEDDSNVVITEEKKKGFNSKYLLLGISGVVLVVGAVLVLLGLRTGKQPAEKTAAEESKQKDDQTEEQS